MPALPRALHGLASQPQMPVGRVARGPLLVSVLQLLAHGDAELDLTEQDQEVSGRHRRRGRGALLRIVAGGASRLQVLGRQDLDRHGAVAGDAVRPSAARDQALVVPALSEEPQLLLMAGAAGGGDARVVHLAAGLPGGVHVAMRRLTFTPGGVAAVTSVARGSGLPVR